MAREHSDEPHGPDRLPDTSALSRAQVARRQRILDEALRIVAEGDDEKVQMRDVADHAGVALGTAYRYFGSKDRLLAEAYRQWVLATNDRCLQRATSGATNVERMRHVALAVLDSLAESPRIPVVARGLRAAEAEPGVLEIMEEVDEASLELYRCLLVGIEPRDADAIAMLMASVVNLSMDRLSLGIEEPGVARRRIAKAARVVLEFRDPALDGRPAGTG